METNQTPALRTVSQFLAEQPSIGRKKFYQLLKTKRVPAYRMDRRILLDPVEVLKALRDGEEKRNATLGYNEEGLNSTNQRRHK